MKAIHDPSCKISLRPEDPEGTRECGGTFRCPTCKRELGWCKGASDDRPDECDECWCARHVDALRDILALVGAVGFGATYREELQRVERERYEARQRARKEYAP